MNVHPAHVFLEFLVQTKMLHSCVEIARMDILAMDKHVTELTEVSIICKLAFLTCAN